MEQKDIDYQSESMLIVDDDQYLREILEELVSTLGFTVTSRSSGKEALKVLEDREYTFLLTDMKMPEMDGLELINKVKEKSDYISMIAMTGFTEGYKYVDVINAGAHDFIKKPFDLEELEAKIRRIINERNLREELSRLSITDSLTGLFNQRHFYIRLKEEVMRSKRQNHPLTLILLDLDNFKSYNDTYGHLAGDEILRKVGEYISQSIREGVDSGYRYGGDEFAVILIDTDLSIAHGIGKRIKELFRENSKMDASIGYAMFSAGMTAEDLVDEADKNLYKSKSPKP